MSSSGLQTKRDNDGVWPSEPVLASTTELNAFRAEPASSTPAYYFLATPSAAVNDVQWTSSSYQHYGRLRSQQLTLGEDSQATSLPTTSHLSESLESRSLWETELSTKIQGSFSEIRQTDIFGKERFEGNSSSAGSPSTDVFFSERDDSIIKATLRPHSEENEIVSKATHYENQFTSRQFSQNLLPTISESSLLQVEVKTQFEGRSDDYTFKVQLPSGYTTLNPATSPVLFESQVTKANVVSVEPTAHSFQGSFVLPEHSYAQSKSILKQFEEPYVSGSYSSEKKPYPSLRYGSLGSSENEIKTPSIAQQWLPAEGSLSHTLSRSRNSEPLPKDSGTNFIPEASPSFVLGARIGDSTEITSSLDLQGGEDLSSSQLSHIDVSSHLEGNRILFSEVLNDEYGVFHVEYSFTSLQGNSYDVLTVLPSPVYRPLLDSESKQVKVSSSAISNLPSDILTVSIGPSSWLTNDVHTREVSYAATSLDPSENELASNAAILTRQYYFDTKRTPPLNFASNFQTSSNTKTFDVRVSYDISPTHVYSSTNKYSSGQTSKVSSYIQNDTLLPVTSLKELTSVAVQSDVLFQQSQLAKNTQESSHIEDPSYSLTPSAFLDVESSSFSNKDSTSSCAALSLDNFTKLTPSLDIDIIGKNQNETTFTLHDASINSMVTTSAFIVSLSSNAQTKQLEPLHTDLFHQNSLGANMAHTNSTAVTSTVSQEHVELSPGKSIHPSTVKPTAMTVEHISKTAVMETSKTLRASTTPTPNVPSIDGRDAVLASTRLQTPGPSQPSILTPSPSSVLPTPTSIQITGPLDPSTLQGSDKAFIPAPPPVRDSVTTVFEEFNTKQIISLVPTKTPKEPRTSRVIKSSNIQPSAVVTQASSLTTAVPSEPGGLGTTSPSTVPPFPGDRSNSTHGKEYFLLKRLRER